MTTLVGVLGPVLAGVLVDNRGPTATPPGTHSPTRAQPASSNQPSCLRAMPRPICLKSGVYLALRLAKQGRQSSQKNLGRVREKVRYSRPGLEVPAPCLARLALPAARRATRPLWTCTLSPCVSRARVCQAVDGSTLSPCLLRLRRSCFQLPWRCCMRARRLHARALP